MKNLIKSLIMFLIVTSTFSCTSKSNKTGEPDNQFNYFVDQFEDMRVLRYRLPGFESLTPKQKELVYYLSEAALCGRDILWDQNFRYNLLIRKTLEAILESYSGDKETEDYKAFLTYCKRVFFANGIHHHYSSDKFTPGFSREYFTGLVKNCDPSLLPARNGKSADDLLNLIVPVIFDPAIFPKKVERGEGKDIIAESASGFYEGVTQKEVEKYYAALIDPKDPRPVSTGLNSRIVKRNGKIEEEIYRSGGLYGEAIDKIIYWL
ncbi:MAG: dihydrofolate reductase, partial [Bacteroidales bacterium]|nr:dihydrofolate reductase [Bacteroidales bacterium]